jgi:uncharacterized protein (DUF433 family)
MEAGSSAGASPMNYMTCTCPYPPSWGETLVLLLLQDGGVGGRLIRPGSTLTTVFGSVTIFHRIIPLIGAVMTTDRIEINPEVMLGKPVIRGTRIPVELILRKLSEGATEADLLDAYPRLTRIDIQAALAYAADTVAHETILLQTP